MPFRLYNSLTKQVEDFRPADPARITFYTCGPTVYDFAHIGNFRSFLLADVARRWLESPLCEVIAPDGSVHKGPREVVHVMNITDVGHMTDDDSLDGAGVDRMEEGGRRLLEMKKAGKLPPGAPSDIDPNNPYAIAEFYASAFLEDARLLGLKVAIEAQEKPELMPRPTQKIARMQAIIRELLAKKLAYIVPGPGGAGASGGAGAAVYFDVRAYDRAGGNYGALSGNTLDKLRAGAGGRVSAANQSGKRDPADFMLWKVDPSHRMKWAFEGVGEGYPGWHIECSAMAREVFGDTLDLHSGGEDNIFPHHECEIAQSRAASGQPLFARHWLHVRHLQVEGQKMSKSKGNFYTIRDLVGKGFDPAAIRLELIKTHYRSNANFTLQGIADSQRRVKRWRRHAGWLTRNVTGFVDMSSPPPAKSGEDLCIAVMHHPLLGPTLNGMSSDLTLSSALAAMDSISRQEDEARLQEWDDFLKKRGQPSMAVEDWDAEADRLLPQSPLPSSLCVQWARVLAEDSEHRWAQELATMHLVDNILGVIFTPRIAPNSDDLASSYKSRIEAARAAKNYAESDRLRAEAEGAGYEVRLSRDGASVTRRAAL